jgi:S1-C subfamily serine protease
MLRELLSAASAKPVERLAEPQEVARLLREELQKVGYRVAGGSGARVDGPADVRPSLILRPTLNNVALSACDNSKGYTSWSSVTIEWELYDPNTRSAVLTKTTGGTARSNGGGSYAESYAAALRNLLAEPAFPVAARSSLPPSQDTMYPALSLGVVTVAPDPARTPQLLKHAPRAVVRIMKGREEGSGVIVSASGQVLTAAHLLAGPSGTVEVELTDGRRIRGTVLRTSSTADVALIELPRGTFPVMPIGAPSELRPRGEVLAIAPPTREKRDRHVTKGIISSLRKSGDRTFIQSDVIMHRDSSGGPLLDEHGRLIGIAIGRMGAGENTFLGVEHAWRALQIQPQVDTVDSEALVTHSPATN